MDDDQPDGAGDMAARSFDMTEASSAVAVVRRRKQRAILERDARVFRCTIVVLFCGG